MCSPTLPRWPCGPEGGAWFASEGRELPVSASGGVAGEGDLGARCSPPLNPWPRGISPPAERGPRKAREPMTAEQQLERSVLEGKERDELHAIAQALSVKTTSRTKKADIIDGILKATGVAGDDERQPLAASNGRGAARRPTTDRRSSKGIRHQPCQPCPSGRPTTPSSRTAGRGPGRRAGCPHLDGR